MSTNDDSTTVILLCNSAAQTSLMCFFASVPTAEDNEAPIDTASLIPSPNTPFTTWEGNQLTGTFATHLLFTTQIQGTAFSQPLNTQVGTAYHSPPFEAPAPGSPPLGFNVFGVFKDNGRTVYTDPVLGAVNTLYYCVANGQTVQSIPDFVPIP